MKLRNLFYLLLAMPLFVAGCSEFGFGEPKKEVALELTSEATLNFEAEGGQGTIAYNLKNAEAGAVPTATCAAQWVTNVTVGETVTFDVAANEGEARDTKVVVTYKDKYFEVTVNQKAGVAVEYLYEENFATAYRESLVNYGYANNYIHVMFSSEDEANSLAMLFLADTNEAILAAGDYSSEDGNILASWCEYYIGEDEAYYFSSSEINATVSGDLNSYTFDIYITDEDGNNFHFTYEGAVEAMDTAISVLPTEPVNFVAEHFDGSYYYDNFNYWVILSDKGFSEDDDEIAGGTYYYIDLYSVAGNIDDEGYVTIPAGTYTFDADGTLEEWYIGNYDSSYTKVNADGSGYVGVGQFESGEAVVTANGITLTVNIGGVLHTVTYTGAPKLYVGIPSQDVEFEAGCAYAFYYGDYYSDGVTDNFYLFLSDIGIDENQWEQANGTYYRFDIYTPLCDGTTIPAGTYTIDLEGSMAEYTSDANNSGYFVMDEYGYDYAIVDWFESGYVTINEDGSFEAEVVMMVAGSTHTITYSGDAITIYDESGSGGGGDYGDIWSNLTSDWRCNFSDHTLYAYSYGDYYEVGLQNWGVLIYPNNEVGDCLQFDVLAGANITDGFAGEYTISDSLGAYTAYPGEFDDYLEETIGSWFYRYGENDEYLMAPFMDGWLDIADNGDGTFTLEFDVWDDADYNITGSYTGEVVYLSQESLSATRSGAKKIGKSLVVAEQKPARSKESFPVYKPTKKGVHKVFKSR